MDQRMKHRIMQLVADLALISVDLEAAHEDEASDVCDSCSCELSDVITNCEEKGAVDD